MLTRDTQTSETSNTVAQGQPSNRVVSVIVVLILLGALAAFALFSGGREKKPLEAKKAAVVRVAKVERQNVPKELKAVGHVEPLSTVAVRSRVDGELVDVLFAEGDRVKRRTTPFHYRSSPV